MTRAARLARILSVAAAGALAVVLLTWVLEHLMPAPFSGYFALVVMGLVATELIRRQPRHRAERMFRLYCRARERGADESAARQRVLRRLCRSAMARGRLGPRVEAAWTGATEKDRVIAGVAVLLTGEGKTLDPAALASAWDRVRDRFTIPGWEALPKEFVESLRARLPAGDLSQLDALAERYRLFHQRFFRQPSALAVDPAASVVDFARLLASVANHTAKEAPGDAERAYRLSLKLRPAENLAHAGLALLLAETGRTREAAREAALALGVLDAFAQRASDRAPATEDIYPFKSPAPLREALERVVAGA
jgi:hypothetical protein